jgi:ectoine hydroxylase-related dioxygenase (phytanoyl-CoA dioxygenase family)
MIRSLRDLLKGTRPKQEESESRLVVENNNLEFDQATLPWVDKKSFPDELAHRLAQQIITAQDADLLQRWHEDGYVIFRGLIEPHLIDALWRDYERAWRERPVCRVHVEGKGLILLSEAPPRSELHHHHFRFQDFHNVTEAGRMIMLHPGIVRFLSQAFDEPPVGMQSLTFEYGTEQHLHQDFAFVNVGFRINSHLAAAWVACEDVGPEQGPLVLYRGSHRIPKFDFGDGRILFPHTDDSSILDKFEEHLQQQCDRMRLTREIFIARKGDVLLWHGALVHGGLPVTDRTATRKSFTCHYSTGTSYPRYHWNLNQDPKVFWLNGGMSYELELPGHVENQYRLSDQPDSPEKPATPAHATAAPPKSHTSATPGGGTVMPHREEQQPTIYPKGVVDFIKNDVELRKRFGAIAADHPLHVYRGSSENFSADFEAWMWNEGVKKSAEIKKYVFFLSLMSQVFDRIYFAFDKQNPGRGNEKDSIAVATSSQEMFYIAKYLYYLDSYGIQGDVLECGCFKGFSSCCLSWVCDFLGRKLIVADSFEGLPEIGHSYYKAHDYKGEFETVKTNLYTLGRLRSVEFVKGWYSESLVGFNRPLCLLWMDVDLYQSTRDVLASVYTSLNREGVIFAHEFNVQCIKDDTIADTAPSEVAQAIKHFFDARKIPYKVKFLTGCLGLVVPNVSDGRVLLTRSNPSLLQRYELFGSLQQPPTLSALAPVARPTKFWIDEINGSPITWTDPTCGSLDRKLASKEVSEIIVKGWAIDDDSKDLAEGVYIDIDGKLFLANYGLDRTDVAQALGSARYRCSGFEGFIPVSELAEGPHTLSVKIVARDRKSYYHLPTKVRFVIG